MKAIVGALPDASGDVLGSNAVKAGLLGRAPKPFIVGRQVELLMDNGRLVRGEVKAAGKRVALLDVGWIPAGDHGPGYPHINIIVYAQVRQWRKPKPDSPRGTWMPEHPDYQKERQR